MTSPLTDQLATALSARAPLFERLAEEGTEAYRVFHGSAEGAPGLTVDRYGDALLVQTFHQALSADDLAAIETFYAKAYPGLPVIWNDRSAGNSRVSNELNAAQSEAAALPREFSELGVKYRFQGRHEGQDPWLFLDLRAARRRVMAEAADKSVLNLFAYTCGVGVAAAKAGAKHVVNVDFSASSLAVGKDNARLNDLPIRVRFVKSDVFPALRQLAGQGQSKVVRGKRMPPFPPLEGRQFDLVFLDPPRYAKSLFGVVDLVNDYSALFNLALRTTAEGGTLICCNNVAQVAREDWVDQLQRSAKKIGRPVHAVEWIEPESDFPSPDGNPPLKVVLLRV
ncbi:class I SAM-dependent rRNA methyltransferase [Denitromonas ohlonensis]|uniref:Class I SAM-dependent rRNA methyltransferase n=2 Tax=Denitromonas TaxID=139331 RepID=A0A557RIJ6_9RHOO|nr:class I SAM-dependent methyltransferase [Denitromonas ohlonensis]TVO64968.1 class I SAM-dependent rRNA methyltransferase [Denitromonas ohlonensis]TVO75641.1 class I SAM-dependent rRNA methyltransferase [Denitromonas ohlonensis]